MALLPDHKVLERFRLHVPLSLRNMPSQSPQFSSVNSTPYSALSLSCILFLPIYFLSENRIFVTDVPRMCLFNSQNDAGKTLEKAFSRGAQ